MWSLGAASLALAVVLSACKVEKINDDFGGGTVGVGVGSGGFIPPCNTSAPSSIHASLTLNDEPLRVDAKDEAGQLGPEPLDVDGVFHPSSDGFVLDACGVNPCAEPALYAAKLDLAGGHVTAPEGALVRLHYDAQADGSFAVVVSNLPEISGVANPVDPKAHPWFQVTNGLEADAPFSVAFTLRATCESDDTSFQGHDLVISVTGSPELSFTAPNQSIDFWELHASPLAGVYEWRTIAGFSDGETAFAAMYIVWKGPVE